MTLTSYSGDRVLWWNPSRSRCPSSVMPVKVRLSSAGLRFATAPLCSDHIGTFGEW